MNYYYVNLGVKKIKVSIRLIKILTISCIYLPYGVLYMCFINSKLIINFIIISFTSRSKRKRKSKPKTKAFLQLHQDIRKSFDILSKNYEGYKCNNFF